MLVTIQKCLTVVFFLLTDAQKYTIYHFVLVITFERFNVHVNCKIVGSIVF